MEDEVESISFDKSTLCLEYAKVKIKKNKK
jgi:hypothetical protein